MKLAIVSFKFYLDDSLTRSVYIHVLVERKKSITVTLTVNSEILARTLFKIKPTRNGKVTLSFIDIGKSCLSRKFSHH